MPGAEHILTEEEEKYFETRGRAIPPGYDSAESENQRAEDGVDGQRDEESSSEPDESVYQRTEAEDSESGDDGEASIAADQSESAKRQTKRDFEKAYGITESKRQQLAKENEQLRRQLDAIARQHQAQPREQQEQIPDKNEDPLGYLAWQNENLSRTVSQQQNYLQQQAQYQQQSQKLNQFIGAYRKSADEFSQSQPDFKEAYKFLEESRISEYTAAGYSPQEASQLLQEDEMAVAIKAFQEGVNPAERIYNLARARGYGQRKSYKLDKVAEGINKGKSLPRQGGKSPERAFDLSRIDELSDDEFDKLFSQHKLEQTKKTKKW